MAKQKPGIYVPLSAYYFDDVAIMEAGEDAELLYVRMLAYAARQIEREGFIPEQVVLSRLGILPGVGNEGGNGGGNGGGNEGGSDAGTRAGKTACPLAGCRATQLCGCGQRTLVLGAQPGFAKKRPQNLQCRTS